MNKVLLINLLGKKKILESGNEFLTRLMQYHTSSIVESQAIINELINISNVQYMDVELKNFFANPALKKKIDKYDGKVIELLGKFQAIWDSPGIALDPLDVNQLDSVFHLFNG